MVSGNSALLSLAMRMMVTALFVVVATFAAERAGAVVGAMIATLPIAAGPAYVFLALDHDAQFIAGSALASLVVNAVTCIFALVYASLAQTRGLLASVLAALATWLALASAARAVPWTIAGAIGVNVVVLAGCLVLGERLRHARLPLARRRWYDVSLRATLVSALVAGVVGLSSALGPSITGTLAVFPVVLLSLMVVLHARLGGSAAAAVLANTMLGLAGFGGACLTALLTVERLGTPLGLTLALTVSVFANLSFWALRRGRRPREQG
ncbi:MAG: hypothetical protein HY056_02300 [Proteobacteria bacterium]|nr:hypothetical protein [Pseudomonadota bacterium]